MKATTTKGLTFAEGVRAMTAQAFDNTMAVWAAQEARLRTSGYTEAADKQSELVARFREARNA